MTDDIVGLQAVSPITLTGTFDDPAAWFTPPRERFAIYLPARHLPRKMKKREQKRAAGRPLGQREQYRPAPRSDLFATFDADVTYESHESAVVMHVTPLAPGKG